MIDLKDTIELMCSSNKKEQLVGEYAQVIIRLHLIKEELLNKESYTEEQIQKISQAITIEEYAKELRETLAQTFTTKEFCNIHAWLIGDEPLLIFEEEIDFPIDIKLVKGQPEICASAGSCGQYYIRQGVTEDYSWAIQSPLFVSKADAIAAWNEMATKLNS